VAEAKLRPQEGRVSAAENAAIACIEYNDKKCTQRPGSSDSNDAPLQYASNTNKSSSSSPLSEELTLKPELAMLRIRTHRCALCLTLCDWEQQHPPRPDSWCNLTEPGRPACADAELQGQVHDALEQIVSCNHNLQQVHFSVVSCNHNLQQVHSSCISLVQSQPAAGALFCSLMQSQPAAGALFLCWYQHGIHTLQEKCTICRKVHLLQV